MENSDYLKMDGNLLRLFLAIYETNSVSAAAEQLDLNQSTVSYGLDRIRTFLRDPLFIKSGRGITPTQKAIMLAPKVVELLADLEGLAKPVAFDPALDSRPIAIASNIVHLLPQWDSLYTSFKEKAPNLPIRVLDLGSRDNVNEMLNSAKVDIAIGFRPDRYSNWLNAMEVHSGERVCFYDAKVRKPIESVDDYCAANHAVVDYGGVLPSKSDAAITNLSLKRNITLYAPNVDALAKLVLGTDQIITFYEGLHKSVFSEFESFKVPVPMGKVHVDMIWHRRDDHSGRSKWIRDIVTSCLLYGPDGTMPQNHNS